MPLSEGGKGLTIICIHLDSIRTWGTDDTMSKPIDFGFKRSRVIGHGANISCSEFTCCPSVACLLSRHNTTRTQPALVGIQSGDIELLYIFPENILVSSGTVVAQQVMSTFAQQSSKRFIHIDSKLARVALTKCFATRVLCVLAGRLLLRLSDFNWTNNHGSHRRTGQSAHLRDNVAYLLERAVQTSGGANAPTCTLWCADRPNCWCAYGWRDTQILFKQAV